ncbi:MAG TPA: hypothetical protein VK193_01510 [Methyloceanibacter sp.]|jgi:hypothetical protein|nr:hypothetical protein [Methyloceanibacter sp.]
MRSKPAEHRHSHVALVATGTEVAAAAVAAPAHGAGWSLLRMSVPARLVMVAAATALLWLAVAWALA